MLRALCLVLLAAMPAWGGGPLRVVTTSTDLKSLVESVGGDRVRVTSLAPAIHEPHAVEVKPSQLAELRSRRRCSCGSGSITSRGSPVCCQPSAMRVQSRAMLSWSIASRGIALLQAETPRVKSERGAHVHGFGNPHYWLDPDNARPITAAILDGLARLAPADRAYFLANRAKFLVELDARLARWSQAMAPHSGTRAVVVHETWPYFARRFGLVVVAAVEPTPGVPPSPAYLADLTSRMKAAGVLLLIAGPESSASLVRQVAGRSGARAVTLIPSVGGDPEARDYLALFDVNIRRLTEALASH